MCALYCSGVIYEFTLHSKRVFTLSFSCWVHNGLLESELDITVKEAGNLFFSCISRKTIGPFVFCLYVFVMLNVIESSTTCLHWFGFNCLASLGFERRIWMEAVVLCRFVCYTHVPFPYNRFLVYVWALGRADLNEQFFVIERDWDNWSIESNKVYCH